MDLEDLENHSELKNLLNSYSYINIKYKEDNYVVVENDKLITLTITINDKQNKYEIQTMDEYKFRSINKFSTNTYEKFLKLLENELEMLKDYR